MEVKSARDCLNRIDNMIFDKSLKFMLKDNLELIRNHIVSQQADAMVKGEYIEDRLAVLSVLTQINHILEKFFLYDTEEELDGEYNKLRQKLLDWYETVNTKPEKKFYFKEIRFNNRLLLVNMFIITLNWVR